MYKAGLAVGSPPLHDCDPHFGAPASASGDQILHPSLSDLSSRRGQVLKTVKHDYLHGCLSAPLIKVLLRSAMEEP
jgi:hypothetical protein